MPSHIFTRVGFWKDSIAANIASVQAAKADKSAGDQMHGQDYLVYAYLQLDQDKNARAVIDDMAVSTFGPDAFAAHFAAAASPARDMVERGDWKGAAALQVRPNKFPHVMAITYFARALGAARSGNPDAAKDDIAKLAEMRDKLTAAKVGYWPHIVDIQYQIATAWMLYAEGKYDDALKAMSAAADAENKTEKSPVTPGPLMPARELYGYMLLDRGMAKEALAAFEATMAKELNRFNGYAGAAKAAQALGDKAKAKANYEKLVALASAGDNDRPVLAEAKAFVASN
jgi:tetratricopeptide (TPR) repeat protein